MVSDSFSIALGIPSNHFKKTTQTKSTLIPSTYKASLDFSPQPKSLSIHYNRVNNKIDGIPSSLLTYMQLPDCKTGFIPMNLVFLELDILHCYLDSSLLDENNNAVISKIFFLKLFNKDNVYL